MRKPPEPCCVCHQAKPANKRSRNKTCGGAACIAKLRSEHGQIGAAITADKWRAIRATGNPVARLSAAWTPRSARIVPPKSIHRTVLQPCIAPYIASLAAASKSVETRA